MIGAENSGDVRPTANARCLDTTAEYEEEGGYWQFWSLRRNLIEINDDGEVFEEEERLEMCFSFDERNNFGHYVGVSNLGDKVVREALACAHHAGWFEAGVYYNFSVELGGYHTYKLSFVYSSKFVESYRLEADDDDEEQDMSARHLACRDWPPIISREAGDLLSAFYNPALTCAVRYDRTTGYFSAGALVLAARGIESLVRNGGHIRLIVGCTLDQPEIDAISRGLAVREAVAQRLATVDLEPADWAVADALELLAWLVERGTLEIKVAVPCDVLRRPTLSGALFHDKSGLIEDAAGDRLAFRGSLNETAAGWRDNWESLATFTSWANAAHVEAIDQEIGDLWHGRAQRALVVDLPTAIRDRLLRFLPPDATLPRRMEVYSDAEPSGMPEVTEEPAPSLEPPTDPRRLLWAFLWRAATLPNGGERVGEATSAVEPWPHQVRAFKRMWDSWPPRLLIADEVGLGKTIQAGLLLRQAWLSGRARRILVLVPRAVLRQWQIELREKFNLSWPIYDGSKLIWYRSPGQQLVDRPVGRDGWHREPFVLASSHLMRRRDRLPELLEQAERWDLVVLDEAHHARRRAAANTTEDRPNRLLALMRRLRERTDGLVLLTATPMQVHPIEVWDLLSLLGLPPEWHPQAFLDFFDLVGKPAPSHPELARLAAMFRAVERAFGAAAEADARRHVPNESALKARKVLSALRDEADTPRKNLSAEERTAARTIMLTNTPLKRLVSRHTRDLLRRYQTSGRLSTRLATRKVEDCFVELTPAERAVYDAVEEYISTTWNRAPDERRNAVGFVMTIYRRRLASSFAALAQTLEGRRLEMTEGTPSLTLAEDDLDEDPTGDEELDTDDAALLEQEALDAEERNDIDRLLGAVRLLPVDTKARHLVRQLRRLSSEGYPQAMVFTQYTDTLDFLRDLVSDELGVPVMCFSGRGGEVRQPGGEWDKVGRDEIKRHFRERPAAVLICTDAAAEGLNFQFCGALVNYDMPWNPMRVEQRIGRIDRLGQEHERIRIVNLHYSGTVETDVYAALGKRIGLFQRFVGRLQPILARLPREIATATLRGDDEAAKARLVEGITAEAQAAEVGGFDLDAALDEAISDVPRPTPIYDLDDLATVLARSDLLPAGAEAKRVDKASMSWLAPGLPKPIRVTTSRTYFEAHADSCELWSPGSPVFPRPDGIDDDALDPTEARHLLRTT